MDQLYRILKTIFEITKTETRPITFPCRPRDIILRQMEDWTYIHGQLLLLEEENLITIKQMDTLVIFITEEGIQKIGEMDKVEQANS